MVVPSFFLAAFSFISPYIPSHYISSALVNQTPGTTVNLRIEGQFRTIFEGTVYTWPHDVDPKCGGKHHCDGTNGGNNTIPGPTVTGALDNAASAHGFTWDGCFYEKFDDYLIETIDGETNTANQSWGSVLNYNRTNYGGCQVKVTHLDEVMWAFDEYNKAHYLKLAGPATARINQPVKLTVTDGKTGKPIAEADVDGEKSDMDGHVSITFSTIGVKGLKAEKSDSVRSNKLTIMVRD